MMNISISVKKFEDLNTKELYEILRLRAAVFVVEQHSIYQDLDNKDQKALHVIISTDDKIVGYSRIFDAGDYFDTACIGRVVVHPDYRQNQFGHILVKAAIENIRKFFLQTAITISAQLYLKKFYESHGFVQTSAEYLEDGLPHIEMQKR